jgi:hypothetical protein
VTKADIATASKCSHELPDSDIPWIDCPSMLTIEDIASDMSEGQYADSHHNAASKVKIPPNLWFIDIVLYRNMCPLGHKTQRRDMFLSALYSFHRGFWCSILEIIWRQIYKFWILHSYAVYLILALYARMQARSIVSTGLKRCALNHT